MHCLRKQQLEQTNIGPFRHVRPGKIKKTRTGGYGLLRLGTRKGLWMRRPRKLLWKSVLSMDKLDAFLDNLQNEIFGRLPEKDQHCAGLAARTVQEALTDYMIRQRNCNQ